MILVTGGTGFIGSHLVERLAAQGRRVRCLVRRSTTNLPAAVELAHGDLETGAGLAEALRGVDTVIHLAGVTKARTIADYDRGNAVATANLLRAAAGHIDQIGRFVHVSSLAAAGPSPADRPLTGQRVGRTRMRPRTPPAATVASAADTPSRPTWRSTMSSSRSAG